AVRAIEPDFRDLPVVREQLGELVDVQTVVARRIPVRGIVAVPGRQVEAGLQSLRAARVHELANDVAATAAERARPDGMPRRRGLPEAESVVVLRGEDHRAETGVARDACPLPGVERGGRERTGILVAVPPFAIAERVHAEVEEHRELVAL